jgi:cytochrome c553
MSPAYGAPESSLLSLKSGALLYSNWARVKGRTLKSNHPLYTDTARQSGTATWLCSECHGWDYLGNKGHYAMGPHSTGIKGIIDAKDKSLQEVVSILSGGLSDHDFSAYLTQKDTEDVARFIKEGLFDNSRALDSDRLGKGSYLKGKIMYVSECESCHGITGEGVDFKEEIEGMQGMRKFCEQEPERTLHAIRWGHPKADMPSGIADNHMMESATIDILTYCQQLEK